MEMFIRKSLHLKIMEEKDLSHFRTGSTDKTKCILIDKFLERFQQELY